jgi:hypothetical protein
MSLLILTTAAASEVLRIESALASTVDHLMLFGTCAEWSRNNLPPALRQQLALPSFREGKRFMGISTVPGPAGVTIDQDSKLPVFGP